MKTYKMHSIKMFKQKVEDSDKINATTI